MILSNPSCKRISIFTLFILMAFVSVLAIKAQLGAVDLSFNAMVSRDTAGGANFALQPDGKIFVFGNFQLINGVSRNQIARLNLDGSLDNSFDCAACDFSIGSVLAQPDGKIIIAGSLFSGATQTFVARVIRVNADGSLDASFSSPYNNTNIPVLSTAATVWAIQPDGKILVSIFSSTGGSNGAALYRLNADGTLDNTFTTISFAVGRNIFEIITKVVVLPDGKILVSTNTSANSGAGANLRRYNADGTIDATFDSPTFTGTAGGFGNGFLINDFEVLADGSIVIVGNFNSVNGISRVNIAKLQPAGNVDLPFAPPNVFQNREPATGVEIYSNGKILVSTGIIVSGVGPSGTTNRFVRFNFDGSLDDTFTSPANLVLINKFIIDSSDNVLLSGSFTENGATIDKFARLNTDGGVGSSFVVNFGLGGSVSTMAIQIDGKIVIAGDFTSVGGVSRRNITRLKLDGSVDESFITGTGFNGGVEKIIVQPDGKILVAGNFTIYNGTAQSGIARLNPDGSLDNGFNGFISSVNGTVYTITLQSDGKIIIGGLFTSVNGQARNGIARLNSDGSLDNSFNPTFGNPSTFQNASIRRVIIQPDGKIIIGGAFTGVNGFARQNLVRLNADGAFDPSFNANNNAEPLPAVSFVELLPGGKYLVLTSKLIRLNNDGTMDNAFRTVTFTGDPSGVSTVSAILVEMDGSIIISGSFTTVNNIPRSRLVRLRADGTVDLTFFPNGANAAVRAIERQADGKLVIGGDFTSVAGITRLGIARLIVSPVRSAFTAFDFDGDGRADVSVFRPSNGFWYGLRSQNNLFFAIQFGQATDRIAPADYDGDGRTDIAVFRDVVFGAGNSAYFYINNSSDGAFIPVQFGATGDVPVAGDWDGDGKADLAVYRDGSLSGGQSFFYYRPSSQPSVNFNTVPLGVTGDKPLVADFDGDGRIDPAVFRPSTATWIILRTSVNQIMQTPFGLPTDIPAPADFNGDGQANLAVFRPSNGFWYIARPTGNPAQNFDAVQFGANGDKPVAADYDGDGRADVAVFRPSNGVWYIMRSSEGLTGVQFGASEDRPIPNAYIFAQGDVVPNTQLR